MVAVADAGASGDRVRRDVHPDPGAQLDLIELIAFAQSMLLHDTIHARTRWLNATPRPCDTRSHRQHSRPSIRHARVPIPPQIKIKPDRKIGYTAPCRVEGWRGGNSWR